MTGQPSYVLTYTGEHGLERVQLRSFEEMAWQLKHLLDVGLHVAVSIHIPLVTPDV